MAHDLEDVQPASAPAAAVVPRSGFAGTLDVPHSGDTAGLAGLAPGSGRSTRSARSVVASLPLSQQASLLRSWQRQAGNRSVQRLLSRPSRPLPVPEPAAVQRACGGPGSCGCTGCGGAKGGGKAEVEAESEGDEEVQRERDGAASPPVAATPGVQRQTFTDGTPENPVATLPPGSRYAGMDTGLLDMLGRTLTGKTFWHWVNVRPKNLGEALDNLGPADINTLVQLKRRLDLHSLWGNIQTMKTVWTTSSLGIDYNGSPMEGALDAHRKFCKDTSIGEALHSGNCWREITDPPGTAGLHYCIANSIHIDPHQVTEGQEGGIQFGGGSIVRLRDNFCNYAMSVWLEHMADVAGGRSVNVFHQHKQLGDTIARERGRVAWLGPRHEEARRQGPILDALEVRRLALSDTLRGWATRGFEGDARAEAQPVIRELNAIEAELLPVRRTLDGAEAVEVPDPTVVYSP